MRAGQVRVPITAEQAKRVAGWLREFKPTQILGPEPPAHRRERLQVAYFLRCAARFKRENVNLSRRLAEIATQAGVGAVMQSPNICVLQFASACREALKGRGRPRRTLAQVRSRIALIESGRIQQQDDPRELRRLRRELNRLEWGERRLARGESFLTATEPYPV